MNIENKSWFVLYTRSRCEKKVAGILSKKNYENYCPLNRQYKQWADRKKWIHEPLFPSYVFIKASEIEINDKKYKWDEIFDALYYNHINNYEDIFSKIYSTAMMTKRWREFSNERKKELIQKANFYINWLNAK